MKKAFALLSLLLAAVCSAGEITNAKSSIVLDGGSYAVTLSADPKEDGWRLLVVNPSRRRSPKEAIRVLGEKDETKEILSPDSPSSKRLHVELAAALKSSPLTPETKAICVMLDRLLLYPELPWAEVHFPEKWE